MKKDFLLSKSKEKFTIDNNTFEIDDYTNILDISNYPILQSPSFSTVIGLILYVFNCKEHKPNKIISKPRRSWNKTSYTKNDSRL